MTMQATPQTTTKAHVEQIMGLPVSVHIRVTDPQRADVAAALEAVWADLRQVDEVFSTWRTDSDLMQIRRGLLTEEAAHPWIGDVAELCGYAEGITGGLFASDLEGPDGSRGWDPTGLVKGWAVDLAAERLRALPRLTFCINAGGDVLCGTGRDAEHLLAPWRVGIADPRDDTAVRKVIEVTTGAVATSGVAARGLHIIDPRTDRPARRLLQATVRGPRLLWADVWATACFIEPTAIPAEGYELVDIVERSSEAG